MIYPSYDGFLHESWSYPIMEKKDNREAEPQKNREPTQPLSGGFPVTASEQPGTDEQEEKGKPSEKLSRLEKLEHKKAQLEQQIKAIQTRENEKVRRERTRRLIQIGAIACKYLQCPDDISPADFEARMKRVVAALGHQQTQE